MAAVLDLLGRRGVAMCYIVPVVASLCKKRTLLALVGIWLMLLHLFQ
jgi:hypothetical protein